MVVLLSQDGQFAGLLVFQALQDGLVVRLWRALQQVVPQGLVLPGLDLTRVLELLLDLELFGLEQTVRRRGDGVRRQPPEEGSGCDSERASGRTLRLLGCWRTSMTCLCVCVRVCVCLSVCVCVCVTTRPYLEALGLLADLHDVLAPQLALPPLVVLQLVGELRLVLRADQVRPHLLDGVDLAELQLLHGLVVAQQHGVLQVLLGLTLVQLLVTHTHTHTQWGSVR